MTSPSPFSEKWLPKSGSGAKGFLILLGKTPKSQSMSIAAPSGPKKSKWALSNPKWVPSLPQSPFWRSRSVHWGVKINCYWKKTSNKMKELRRKTNILWNSPRETQRKPNLSLTSMRLQSVIGVRKSKSKWKMTMMMSRRNWINWSKFKINYCNKMKTSRKKRIWIRLCSRICQFLSRLADLEKLPTFSNSLMTDLLPIYMCSYIFFP